MEWILVELSRLVCFLKISFHTFLGMSPPYYRTTKKHENSRSMEVFSIPPAELLDSNMVLQLSTMFWSFRNVQRCTPRKHDQEKMLVLPSQLLCSVLSTTDQCFVSFHRIQCHPHAKMRTTLFHGTRKSIIGNLLPTEFQKNFLKMPFPQQSCKRMRLRSKGTTGSFIPYWTMILAICVVVDESKCLDSPILEFFSNV